MINENLLTICFSRYLSEFKDKKLEEEFLQQETSSTYKYIRPVILALGILFFLFIIPDYYLNQSDRTFWVILSIRGFFLLLICFLYLLFRKRQNYYSLINWISAYKLLVSIFFILIFYIYESPNFLIQSFGVVALILSFFFVTNRWLYVVCISVFLSIGFIATAYYRFKTIPTSELAVVAIYIVLVLLMSSISSYRINYYKRLQYIYNKELKRAIELDTITGIYARAKFNQEMDKWIDLAKRYNHALSLVLFDVDDFKKINDDHGHLAGDRILTVMARIVRSAVRQSDVFARWGGDEFAILLPHTEIAQAFELAERIRVIIATNSFEPVGFVSCSFGVTNYQSEDDSSTFLFRADEKLYQAKNSGKNLVL